MLDIAFTPSCAARFFVWLGLASLASCSSGPSGTLTLTLGGEPDTLTRAPAPTTLLVESVDEATGARKTLAQSALPASTIDLGNPSYTTVASIQVTGKDASGKAIVFGASPFVQFDVLDGATLPIFIQRTGEWARMPGSLADARSAPLLAASTRNILVAGGTGTSSVDGGAPPMIGYDYVFYQALSSTCQSPRLPRSFGIATMAASTTNDPAALLVNDDGASLVDLTNCISADLTAPTGQSFGSVSGGVTAYGDDGSVYVVGPTKPDTASGAVLKIDPSGNGSFLSAAPARKGAAAAWVTGTGLLVYGGSSTGAGAEVLGASSSVSLGYPADPVTGTAIALFDKNVALLVGGADATGAPLGPRTLDLGCANGCHLTSWGQPPPMVLSPVQVFVLAPGVVSGVALIVGDDAQGLTHVFRVDASSTTETAPKLARHGARAIAAATGAVVLLGGGSSTPESFVR